MVKPAADRWGKMQGRNVAFYSCIKIDEVVKSLKSVYVSEKILKTVKILLA